MTSLKMLKCNLVFILFMKYFSYLLLSVVICYLKLYFMYIYFVYSFYKYWFCYLLLFVVNSHRFYEFKNIEI